MDEMRKMMLVTGQKGHSSRTEPVIDQHLAHYPPVHDPVKWDLLFLYPAVGASLAAGAVCAPLIIAHPSAAHHLPGALSPVTSSR